MPRGDPVHGVGIVRYANAVSDQLLAKSYRAGAGNRRRFLQRGNPPGQLLRPVDGRLPQPLPVRRIERGEDLPVPAVEHRQRRAVPFGRSAAMRNSGAGLEDPARESVEGADTAGGQPEADAEAMCRGDPDPQPGEGAGTQSDPEQVDRRPAAGGFGRPLDLGEQAGRVPGPALRG